MSATGLPLKALTAVTAGVAVLGALAACAGTTQAPNAATSASAVPGSAPLLGEASQGAVSVTATSIQRSGTELTVTARIHNAGPTTEELLAIGSQVSPTLTLTPPLQIPPGATRDLSAAGAGGAAAVLQQQGRLEPGGTVALSMQFHGAGLVQVFSSFR